MSAPKKLRRPVEEVRAELLRDPHTQNIARKVGLSLEAYVEKVLDYAQHPDKEPVLNVIPEGEVAAAGGATVEEVKTWFEKVERGEIPIGGPRPTKDEFEIPGKKTGNS